MIKYSLLAVTAVIFLAGGGGISLIQEADAQTFNAKIISPTITPIGGLNYTSDSPVRIHIQLEHNTNINGHTSVIQLENANFASYYGRLQNQPTQGQGTIEIRVNPTSQGVVKVTLPANQVSYVHNSQTLANIEAVYSFIYDTIAPTFVGYSDLVNTNTIKIGGTAPLPSITGLCVDANFSSNRDAVRGTITAVDTSTEGTYTNTYICTDDAGNDATLSVAYLVGNRITPTITSTESVSTSLTSIPMAVTFDSGVKGFDLSDLAVTNGAASSFVRVSSSHYTFNIEPISDGNVVVHIPAAAAIAAVGPPYTLKVASFSISYTAPALNVRTITTDFSITNTNNTITTSSTITINGIANQTGYTFELRNGTHQSSHLINTLNNVPLTSFTFENVPLSHGENTFFLYESDEYLLYSEIYTVTHYLDSDSDGVYDHLDDCSNSPSGQVVNENGCQVHVCEIVADGFTINTFYDNGVLTICGSKHFAQSLLALYVGYDLQLYSQEQLEFYAEQNHDPSTITFLAATTQSQTLLTPSKLYTFDIPNLVYDGTYTVKLTETPFPTGDPVTRTHYVTIGVNPVFEYAYDPPKKKKSGSSDDWHKKPTFGQSHLTHKQIIDNGFSFNGHDLTITDNWHTDFLLTSSIIGESNTVTIKTYSADPLKWVDLHLGVPRQGGFSEAESHINLVVSRNYTNPVDYTIDEINHYQKENLIDESDTTASVNKVKCQSTDNDEKCYEFTILFAVNAPLLDNVVAISAMDEKRRQHVTYINEGVEFTGESLLDPRTAQLMEKLGNQYDATIIELTQQDRRYNVWEDQHGYLWSQNEYGTWMQTTHPDFERFQDGISNVMTRQNSNFASLIEHERQKALLVFDSSDIASQVGDYFAYDYSNIDRDTSKLEKYYLELQIENQKAQQYTNKN